MDINKNFLDKFWGNKDITSTTELGAVLTEKIFTLRDIGDISNRVMHNWVKENLVPGYKVIPKKKSLDKLDSTIHTWHRFSFLDYVWLRILIELRKFDVSFSIIQRIKENLLFNIAIGQFLELLKDHIDQIENIIPKEHQDEFHAWLESPEKDSDIAEIHSKLNFLFFLLCEIIIDKEDISLVIDNEGIVYPYSLVYHERHKEDEEYIQVISGHHISISLTKIISEFISNSKELEKNPLRLKLLSEQEIKIVNLLRTEKLKELKIRFDENSKPVLIELTSNKKANLDTRIVDLIYNNGYFSISIETAEGKVIHCRNTRKIKLK
jgi:hypothetical protein